MATVRTWNVEWATSASKTADRVRALLEFGHPDVLVVTELGDGRLLPASGHVVDAGSDWGYEAPRARRKVTMWSRSPWTEVADHAEYGFPPGRLVAAVTATPLGPLRIIGVCIPWSDAHVRSGRRNRERWEDHGRFLHALGLLLRDSGGERTVLAGDFNQRVPRAGQPPSMFELLERALAGRLVLATAGLTVEEDGGRQLIDHIAHSPDLASSASSFFGRDVSDHNGVTARLGLVE